MSVKMMRMICIPCIIISIALFIIMLLTDMTKGPLLCGILAIQMICSLVQLVYISGEKNDK